MLSFSPDRSGAVSLEGETVFGDAYIFLTPETNVTQVRFYLDGVLEQKENNAPFDFQGGSVNSAKEWDTSDVSDGPHTITTEIDVSGGTQVVTTTFSVFNNAPALVFSPDTLSFSANSGGAPPDQTSTLSTSDASTADYSISETAEWLIVSPLSGSTSDVVTISVDASGLAEGTYTAQVTASAAGYNSALLSVTLAVGESGGYAIQVSSAFDRSNPEPLDGATVSGDMFAFTAPDTDVSRVSFFVDDPAMTTTPKVENLAPYDLAGTGSGGVALPYDTTQLLDGPHSVTAAIDLVSGGTIVITANFTVLNSAPGFVLTPQVLSFSAPSGESPPDQTADLTVSDGSSVAYTLTGGASWLTVTNVGTTPETLNVSVDSSALADGVYATSVTAQAQGYVSATLSITLTVGEGTSAYNLVVSYSSDRSNPTPLSGATVAGNAYVFVTPDTSVDQAKFYLDGVLQQIEGSAPFDFAGGSTTSANPWNTANVQDGLHTITVELTLLDAGIETVSVTFSVLNNAPGLSFSPGTLSFAAPSGGGALPSQSTNIATTDSTVTDFTLSEDTDWLSLSVTSGTTPASIAVTADATGLPDGFYTASVGATASGYLPGNLTVTLTVGDVSGGGDYSIMLSTAPDRSNPTFLNGQTVSDLIYVFTSPDTGVDHVDFYVDDISMSGAPFRTESQPPYDLAGTGNNGVANPFNTASLADIPHTVTAEVFLSGGGSVVLTASFVVDNGCYPLACSEILVDLPYQLDFAQGHGKIPDANNVGTGFTYVDSTADSGYLPANMHMNLPAGTFELTTTAGLATGNENALDNALAVGVDAPSQISMITGTLINPGGTGNDEQAGVWFGVDQDNHVKLAVVSRPTGQVIEYIIEHNGVITDSVATAEMDLTGSTVLLSIRTNPVDQTIVASYKVDSAAAQNLGTFIGPSEFFSFDGAGINPVIGTRSFAGVLASHASGPAPLTYTFDQFSVEGEGLPIISSGNFTFSQSTFSVSFPTSLAWGPDGRLYVTEMFGDIHAFTLDENNQVLDDEVITTVVDDLGVSSRLMLGITVDPISTPDDVILWVSHSNGSVNNGQPNSGMITRLSGPGFTTVEHVITGLPRAIANHATNSLHFGPDDRLYIAQGGNTGAGAPNTANTEFGDMAEQPLSAAILVADVRDPDFDGSCHNASDIFGPPPCEVVPHATGLRNAYDFTFHSNGSMYAPDNGLGVTGTYPPTPSPPCTGFADTSLHNPGTQPDELFRIVQGKYYGHPNPYRDECVFKDGSDQGVPPLPNWTPPVFDLGQHRSANGIIEYTGDAFCGALKGELLIANYSSGDDITRVRLSADGLAVVDSSTLISGFGNPLPLLMGPNGTIFVGEHGAGEITALKPIDLGCWETRTPVPESILDAGGAALDGRLYTVAGKKFSGPINSMYIYDPVLDSWTAGPDLPGPAVENPAAVAHNGTLYVFGGSTGPFDGAVTNARVYDPATNQWTELSPMSVGRGGPTAQAVNGKIYVIGGMDSSGSSLDSMEIYDPATDTWSVGPSMSTRRDNPGSAVLGDDIYVFGGRTRNASGQEIDGTLNTVEMYDPDSDTWTSRAPMPTGRRTMVVGTLNGRAQVMGGEKTPEGGTFPQNEEYDPVTDTWRSLLEMPTGRHGAAAGTIDGVVYVAGGGPNGGSSFSTIVEAFAFTEP